MFFTLISLAKNLFFYMCDSVINLKYKNVCKINNFFGNYSKRIRVCYFFIHNYDCNLIKLGYSMLVKWVIKSVGISFSFTV